VSKAELNCSGDLLSLRPYFTFHGGLSMQALQVAKDGYSVAVAPVNSTALMAEWAAGFQTNDVGR
jgi:hypothetical protein